MPLFARPRFFSGGCTVCLFIFFSSHSGLNRLDFFIFSFRRADGFSRPAVFIFPQRLPKRRVLFPLCLQKLSTILEKFLMARSILFLAYKKMPLSAVACRKVLLFCVAFIIPQMPRCLQPSKTLSGFWNSCPYCGIFFQNKSGAKKKTAMWRSFLGNLMLLLFFYIVLKEQVEEYEQGAGNCGFNPEYCRPIGDCFCASLRGKGRVAVD